MVDLSTDNIIVTIDRFVTTTELKRAYREWKERQEEQVTVSNDLGALRKVVYDILKSDRHAQYELKAAAQMKDQLKCPICCSFMSDIILRIQECGHVFCRTCLVEWENSIESMSQSDDSEDGEYEPQLTCPLCRAEVFLPFSKEPTLRFFVRLLSGIELLMQPHEEVNSRLKSRLYIPVPPQTIPFAGISKYSRLNPNPDEGLLRHCFLPACYVPSGPPRHHASFNGCENSPGKLNIFTQDSEVIASTFDLVRKSTRTLIQIIEIQRAEYYVLNILLKVNSNALYQENSTAHRNHFKSSDADTPCVGNVATDSRNASAYSIIPAHHQEKYSC
ncbi:LOW QUALITY PROTEIN: hypothetical protein CVT26_005076 [Gymnopilus dilepis]|uniref:RING-type domain-containing protein n=1 Tax=Gymnopilus dilepis TaxID=231916 RepID=A0A409W8B2_9AGAR|nr:LOW QUALITY PROTEIN: hypothetical protein CVT26_005076 [Gymnopilus dilepis]